MLEQIEKIPKWSPVLWFLESCPELSGPALVFPGQMPFYQVHLSYPLTKEEWWKINVSLPIHTNMYSCFNKGCPTTTQKCTWQCHLVLWAVIVWRYFVEVHSVLLEGKRRHEYTCLCCSLLLCWNTLCFNQATVKPLLPIIIFDIVTLAFMLLWDNLSQKLYKCLHVDHIKQHVLKSNIFKVKLH